MAFACGLRRMKMSAFACGLRRMKEVIKMKKTLKIMLASVVLGAVLVLGVLFFGSGLKVADVRAADSFKLLASNLGELAGLLTVDDLRVNNDLQVGNTISNQGQTKKTPLKIADTLKPTKNKKYNLGSKKKKWNKAYIKELKGKDVVKTNNLVANAVTQTGESNWDQSSQTTTAYGLNYALATDQVVITTDSSTLFCTFSGTFTTSLSNGKVYVFFVIDGQPILASARSGQPGTADYTFTLATNTLTNVNAGTHTVQIGYHSGLEFTGATTTLFNHTLDVIELKK